MLPETVSERAKPVSCARGVGEPLLRLVTRGFARRASSIEQITMILYPRSGNAIIAWRPMLALPRVTGSRVVRVKYIYAPFVSASGVSLCVMRVGGICGRVLASLVAVRLHP